MKSAVESLLAACAVPPRTRAALGVIALGVLPAISTAQLAPGAKKEIEGLLVAVGTSGCEFVRGGTAHPPAKAQQHLQKKYDYLAARDKMASTEDFIVMAASRSSMTGEAYGIRCAGSPQQNSEDWMKAKLAAMRQAAPR
jgi:hypothetical protein